MGHGWRFGSEAPFLQRGPCWRWPWALAVGQPPASLGGGSVGCNGSLHLCISSYLGQTAYFLGAFLERLPAGEVLPLCCPADALRASGEDSCLQILGVRMVTWGLPCVCPDG